jgi:hypothetical protein
MRRARLCRSRCATAELLHVSVRQIHNLANAGLLKRVRIGKRCGRITTASVIELIGE